MIGLKEFKKMINTQQKDIINQIYFKYIDELKNLNKISNEMNICESTIRTILKEQNIKRTKEQVVLAIKKYKLETYGDENYCNSAKIKESLKNNSFNPGEHAQMVIAQKKIKNEGLMSFCLLNDVEKQQYIKLILKCYDEYLTNDEICEKLKITRGCYKLLCNFGKIKRTSIQHHKMCENVNLKKFGVKNAYQREDVKNKIKQTNRERYGVDYSWQAEEVKEKSKQTKKERYGDENYRNDEKIKQTCQER